MSDAEQSGNGNGAVENGGVLTNLPRSRPQRASARRAAARYDSASSNGARKPSAKAARPQPKRARKAPAKAAKRPAETEQPAATKPSAAKRRAAAKRPRPATPVEEPAPRQGYECDGETPTGSIQPPAGLELVASAAEIVGELAKAGMTTGERLLKDALSRLPL